MFISSSTLTTHRAILRRIGRVDILNRHPDRLGLVRDKRLQFRKCPSVQTGTDAFPGTYPFADVGQGLHRHSGRPNSNGFLDDGFADFVIDLSCMALFPTRESGQSLFCGLAPVGLKTTSECKMTITLVTELTTTKQLTRRCGRQDVFAHIDTQHPPIRINGRMIRQVKNKVQIPLLAPVDQFRFFGHAFDKVRTLKVANLCRDMDAPRHREQRNARRRKAVRAFVVVNASRRLECDRWNRLRSFHLQGTERITHRLNSVTHHLRPQRRNGPNGIVGQVMQRHSIPAPMLYGGWHDQITRLSKRLLHRAQGIGLFWCRNKFKGNGSFHIGNIRNSDRQVKAFQTQGTWLLPAAS